MLHKQIVAKDANVGHVTYSKIFMQFGESQINEVIEKCDLIFTVSDVLKNVQIWHKNYAIMVLNIISDVFGDVVQEKENNYDSESTHSDGDSERYSTHKLVILMLIV